MKILFRRLGFAKVIAVAVIISTIIQTAHALPNDLKLVIPTSEGTQTLNLHKRTARSAACVIYQWSSAGGYVPITPEVRTYRGTITENPNAIVIASIDGDNKLNARCIDMEWGHNVRWEVVSLDVASQLTVPDTNPAPMPAQVVGAPVNGTSGIPKIGPKVPTGVATNGVPYGSIVEYGMALDLTVAAYNRAGQNIDTVLARYEADAMLYETLMLRDLLVRVVVPAIVIRTGNFYSADPGNVRLAEIGTAWRAAPLVSAAWAGVWASEGNYATGNGIGKDESSFSAGALFHEDAHNWTAFHLAYQCDTMGGNKPSLGPMTVDTMLKKRKEAIDENKLPVAAPFPDPMPPHTHVDAVRIQQDTPVTIDVMANDHDANGDALSIHSFTTSTVPGGTVMQVGNTLRYTPPAGYVGKDIIVYTVQDSSSSALRTREVVHIEVVNQGLMVNYQMEETSGTSATNSVAGGSAGDLNGANFATDKVISPLGQGLRVNGFPNDDDIENGLWSGMLVGSGNVVPVPLHPSRQATPFEQEYNQHGGRYDIMDGDYTFATWFRSDSYNGADFPGGIDEAYIASRWWHPETRVGWDLYAFNGRIGMHYRIFDGSTGIQEFSTPYNLVPGKWYHMAAVFDRAANQIRILVNGQVVATKTNAFASNGYIFNGRAPLALGAFSRDKYCYDDVRIYSKALTTPEVQALVAQAGSGTPRFFANPIQYSAYAGLPFAQSLWGNIWSGGDEPLTFEILSGPAWLGVDSGGFLRGNPTPADAGLNTATLRITDSNGDTATATMNINIPVVPTNTLAEWKLDEGSGVTNADSSGNGRTGTLTGATWELGHIDGSLSFNGTSNQVSCGNVPASSQMSFAAWIKPADVIGNKAIFGKSNSYTIKLSGNNLVYTRPGVADYVSSGAGLTANVWQHVVVTVNGGQTNGIKFYKNGVLVSQTSGSGPGVNSNPLLLGNNQFNEYFKGSLDHLQIFNSILTADGVRALYASTYGDGLFAHWKFDEASGLTAADSSGNSNTGTLDSGITRVTGQSGNAVAMATNKKISLGGNPGPAGDWTFSTWVQRKGNTASSILVDGSSTVIKLEQYNNTRRVGITRKGVVDWSFNYTTPLNQWVHLTLVGGDGAVKLYVNGALQDTLAQSVSMPFSTIGSATEGMNAWLDDTIVYERMLSAEEVLNLYYGGNNTNPVWSANPLNKPGATASVAYTSTLAGDATDANGDPLTFTKVNGPSWLSVASNGALSGTPGAGDVGTNNLAVRVSDGRSGTATTTLAIVVAPRTYTLTYSAAANGTLSGTTPQTVNQGASGTAITAVPASGYYFVNWSDGSTANPRTDTAVNANLSLSANFAIKTYSLSYFAGPNGTLTGTTSQTINHDSNGTAVFAVPASGYHFVNWSDGNTTNPRTDTAVTANLSVTANFAINTYTLTYVAGSNGSLIGTTSQIINHGSNGTAVTAVPATGYHFVNWSDGSTANPRTDSSITANLSVTANFAINTYTLTYVAGSNGSLTGTTSQIINHGSNGTAIAAVPATGYHFVNWSDGGTANPRTDSSITANLAVTANFAINTYSLSYSAGPNGSLTGTTSQFINHGSNGTPITAIPDTGYHFVNWSDNSTANPRTDSNITANLTVTANFAINTYTLTYIAGPNGSLAGTTSQTVNHGSSGSEINALPASGYRFTNWSDGSTTNPRTDTSVTENLARTANFELTNPDANGNGILDTWETVMFGNADPGNNAPGDDADKDGLSNFLEYALNTHPLVSNPSPLVHDLVPAAHGNHLRLTVQKNPAATNVTYSVEVTGSVATGTWTTAGTTVESNTSAELRVRDDSGSTSSSQRFIRLKVSAN